MTFLQKTSAKCSTRGQKGLREGVQKENFPETAEGRPDAAKKSIAKPKGFSSMLYLSSIMSFENQIGWCRLLHP